MIAAAEEVEDIAAFDAAMSEGAEHPLDPGEGGPRLGVSEYRIELRPAAGRALRKLDPPVARRLQGAISLPGARSPAARRAPAQGATRAPLRVGDYRISNTIEDDILLIVGHRRDVFKR